MSNLVIVRPLAPEIAFERRLAELTRELAKLGLRPIAGGVAGAWTFTDGARTRMLNGTWDFDTDLFKVALFLSTSNIGAASTTFAGVTSEHAAANGYTAGGLPTGAGTALELTGTTSVKVTESTNYVWTASGGSIVARFAVLYEVGGDVVAYALLDSTPADVTVTDGNTLTLAPHANGIFTLA